MRKRKRMTNLQIFILMETFLFLIIGILFCWCGKEMTRPEHVLNKLCSGIQARDWNSVYDCFNISQEGALTRQMFINAKRKDNNVGFYTGYSYKEYEKEAELGSYEEYTGDTPETKSYVIAFTRADGEKAVTTGATLVKSGKKFLIFDEWKVSPENYVVENTGFSVQKGASMKLNGVEIDLGQASDGNWQAFGIPHLFRGDYQLEVSMPGMDTYREEIRISEDNQDYTIQLLPTKTEVSELYEKVQQDLETILNAALTNESFGIISDLFYVEALESGQIQNTYNELRSRGSNGGIGITWLEIDDLQIDMNVPEMSYEEDSQNNMILTLKGKAKEKNIYADLTTNTLANGTKEFDIEMKAIYVRYNNQWKLGNIPISSEQLQ